MVLGVGCQVLGTARNPTPNAQHLLLPYPSVSQPVAERDARAVERIHPTIRVSQHPKPNSYPLHGRQYSLFASNISSTIDLISSRLQTAEVSGSM